MVKKKTKKVIFEKKIASIQRNMTTLRICYLTFSN